MSHITEIKLQVKDLDALKAAAENLGFDFMEGQKTHEWYGQFMDDSREGKEFARTRGIGAMGKCEHALRAKDHKHGDYEIGVVKSLDGEGYELSYDSWGSGRKLEAKAGPKLNTLRREYAVEVATKAANKKLRREGFRVQREDLPGGRVRLRLKKR